MHMLLCCCAAVLLCCLVSDAASWHTSSPRACRTRQDGYILVPNECLEPNDRAIEPTSYGTSGGREYGSTTPLVVLLKRATERGRSSVQDDLGTLALGMFELRWSEGAALQC